jgi:hypothetical protein
MNIRFRALIVVALAAALPGPQSGAGEIGHQGGGAFNPGDYFGPPEAFIVSVYGNYYDTYALRDPDGNRLTGFDIFGERVDLDIEVQSLQIIPMIIWSPGIKFLGADVSSLWMPIYGQTSVGADLSAFGRRIRIDDDVWGFQDSYAQPVWLTWRTAHWDVATAYGFWAPTGTYDPEGTDNTGSGFWSHVFRASAGWSPDGTRATQVVGSVAFEFNSDKQGLDLTPGSHLTLDFGARHSFSVHFEAGVYGFAQWQVTDDTGRDAVDPGVRDRLFGAGLYMSYWFIPQRVGVLARQTFEFGARDRFEGSSTAVGLNFVF